MSAPVDELVVTEGRMRDGVAGVRDVDHPCEAFRPGETPPGVVPRCQGDGHYICQECEHLAYPKRDDYEERLAEIAAQLDADPAGNAAALGVWWDR